MSATEMLALDEPLLTVDQAAALLNVRPSWVRDATREGRLPCIRVGRHRRYTRSMLAAWVAEQRAGDEDGARRMGNARWRR